MKRRRRNPIQVTDFSEPLIRPDMDRIIQRMLAEVADSNTAREAEDIVLTPIMGRLEDRGEEIIESGELAERPETEEGQLLRDELTLIQAVHTVLDVLSSRLHDMRRPETPLARFSREIDRDMADNDFDVFNRRGNPHRRRRLKRHC